MQEVVRHVLLDQPNAVVECGSGASTMWIGGALCRVGKGRLISLENSADWVAIVTGLRNIGAEERRGSTRSDRAHPGGRTRTAVVLGLRPRRCRGDRSSLGRRAAWAHEQARALPRVPAVCDKLRPGAIVMLDDCHRRDEKETLHRWLAEVAGLSLLRQIDNLAVMKIS
jgi:hypothetical protein